MRSSLYSLPVAFRTSSSNAHFERAFLTRFLREHFEWTSDASQNTVSERTPNALVFECRTNNPHDHEVAVACTHKSCPVLLPPPPSPKQNLEASPWVYSLKTKNRSSYICQCEKQATYDIVLRILRSVLRSIAEHCTQLPNMSIEQSNRSNSQLMLVLYISKKY